MNGKSATAERTDSRRTFDADLERELERRKYDRGNPAAADILGTGEWSQGEDITLHLSVPADVDSRVTVDLEMPSSTSLAESKVGHLLDDHGYEPEQAKHLIGETVSVYYDGEWKIVDPIGVENAMDEENSTDTESVEVQPDQRAENAERSTATQKSTSSRGLFRLIPIGFIIAIFGNVGAGIIMALSAALGVSTLFGVSVGEVVTKVSMGVTIMGVGLAMLPILFFLVVVLVAMALNRGSDGGQTTVDATK